MSALPASFQYFVNKLAGVKRNTVRITPNNSTSVNANGQIIFDLPSNSICDLTSLTMRGNFIFTAAVGGTGGVRMVPQIHTLMRNVAWQCNGQTVAGIGSQNMNHVMEIFRRCTSANEYEISHSDQYLATPVMRNNSYTSDTAPSGSQVATNSTSQRFHFSQWYSLARAPNAENWDTAVFGDLRLVIQLEGNGPILSSADSGTNSADWQLQNLELVVDVLTFADPTYDNLIASMLGQGQTLAVPFPEVYSQISAINAAMKFNVSSQSLDLIGYAPLISSYNSFTQLSSTSGVVADANLTYGPNFTRFRLNNSSGNITASNYVNSTTETYYWNINNEVYPKSGPTAVIDGVTYTTNLFNANAVNKYCLLFKGLDLVSGAPVAGVPSFIRENFQAENCIVAHNLSLDGPAHLSANHLLSGLDTRGTSSTITLYTSGWYSSDYCLLFAQGSAVLEAGAGQVISVVY